MTTKPVVPAAPASPVDVARLEGLAKAKTDHVWSVAEGGVTCEYVAALTNAAPSLLAAYGAVERVEAVTVETLEDHHEPRSEHFVYDGPESTLSAVTCGCSAKLPCDRRSQVTTVWRAHVGRMLRAALSGETE